MLGALMHMQALQRGFTLVEVLVASVVGLVVLSGANAWYLAQLRDHHRAAASLRLTQALRAAADIITRDLRRTAHWQAAYAGVQETPSPNPYRGLSWQNGLRYSHSRDDGEDNNQVNDDGPNERFGFALHDGELRSWVGGAAQALIDRNAATLTEFTVQWQEHEVSLGALCVGPRGPGGSTTRPCCQPSTNQPSQCAATHRTRTWRDGVPQPWVDTPGAEPPPAGAQLHAHCPSLVQATIELTLRAQAPGAQPPLQSSWQQHVALRNAWADGGTCP